MHTDAEAQNRTAAKRNYVTLFGTICYILVLGDCVSPCVSSWYVGRVHQSGVCRTQRPIWRNVRRPADHTFVALMQLRGPIRGSGNPRRRARKMVSAASTLKRKSDDAVGKCLFLRFLFRHPVKIERRAMRALRA
ncbi:hypothetical protein NDU88_002801 [Pleurodeles waltl]|uniref:Uncharacterized protein n=1 Tax=Pleurodeles waltl TaxID=8319 RepID=A0AAV7M519_PLEWA|nr:hypothetical protein NDU88_002801 [Pleurodeles waltl]